MGIGKIYKQLINNDTKNAPCFSHLNTILQKPQNLHLKQKKSVPWVFWHTVPQQHRTSL